MQSHAGGHASAQPSPAPKKPINPGRKFIHLQKSHLQICSFSCRCSISYSSTPILSGARRSTVPAECPSPVKSDPLPGGLPPATGACLLFPDPLATAIASFAGLYKKKRMISVKRVCCSTDDEGEVSPLLPSSCRYVPTCIDYSMQAYERYGLAKGAILTARCMCRCNPLSGQGYDPPRWFGGEELPEE
ncbi:uncharacterized protein LOC112269378 [Brachypodium distachyon]|uniref:uncharacterized protein LOC112269378 n=1 Tax=Brachypodium distachyon TaxID=15368 RepID=UPI000D0CE1D2|nr:uncharacterized protein LOC112269378 [Brachypodium distachyon]|eukprot:XP_024311822.1 uncharacterized protein LOC112269378 [Brachypodium distachyon]